MPAGPCQAQPSALQVRAATHYCGRSDERPVAGMQARAQDPRQIGSRTCGTLEQRNEVRQGCSYGSPRPHGHRSHGGALAAITLRIRQEPEWFHACVHRPCWDDRPGPTPHRRPQTRSSAPLAQAVRPLSHGGHRGPQRLQNRVRASPRRHRPRPAGPGPTAAPQLHPERDASSTPVRPPTAAVRARSDPPSGPVRGGGIRGRGGRPRHLDASSIS